MPVLALVLWWKRSWPENIIVWGSNGQWVGQWTEIHLERPSASGAKAGPHGKKVNIKTFTVGSPSMHTVGWHFLPWLMGVIPQLVLVNVVWTGCCVSLLGWSIQLPVCHPHSSFPSPLVGGSVWDWGYSANHNLTVRDETEHSPTLQLMESI